MKFVKFLASTALVLAFFLLTSTTAILIFRVPELMLHDFLSGYRRASMLGGQYVAMEIAFWGTAATLFALAMAGALSILFDSLLYLLGFRPSAEWFRDFLGRIRGNKLGAG